MTDKLTIRLPEGMRRALEAEYRRTFATHGLSREAWYVQALAALLADSHRHNIA